MKLNFNLKHLTASLIETRCDLLIMCCQINDNLGNFCDPPYNVSVKNDLLSAAVAAGQRRLRLYSDTCNHIRKQYRERKRVLYETNLHCNRIEMSLKLHKNIINFPKGGAIHRKGWFVVVVPQHTLQKIRFEAFMWIDHKRLKRNLKKL